MTAWQIFGLVAASIVLALVTFVAGLFVGFCVAMLHFAEESLKAAAIAIRRKRARWSAPDWREPARDAPPGDPPHQNSGEICPFPPPAKDQ